MRDVPRRIGVVATAQEGQAKRRLTPNEIEALPSANAGAGTSGLPAVTTRVLFGDPTKPGLHTIELKVAPNTVIQTHTHQDTRTAVVVSGLWYFGYAPKNEQALVKALPLGRVLHRTGGRTAPCADGSRRGDRKPLPGMGQLTPAMPSSRSEAFRLDVP